MLKDTPPIIPSHSMPALDGLRGIACLLVVYTHWSNAIGLHKIDSGVTGALGVIIFFSLSGFLMGVLYWSRSFDGKTVPSYIAARLSRIAPAYLMAVSVYVFLCYFFPDFDKVGVGDIVRLYAFSGNVSVFWSIPPEVQFYVFFILLWFSTSLPNGKRWMAVFVLTVSIIFVLYFRSSFPGTLLVSKLHIFLLGALLGYFVRKESSLSKSILNPFSQIVIPLCAVVYLTTLDSVEACYYDLVFSLLVALSVAVLSCTSFVTKFFTLPFVRFIGGASFSIYLFHAMIIRMFEIYLPDLPSCSFIIKALVAIFAIVLPCFFYTVIEKNINLYLKKFLTKNLTQILHPAIDFVLNKVKA